MYHELHNEAAREQVLGMMIRWMDGRLAQEAESETARWTKGLEHERIRRAFLDLRHEVN